VTTSCLVDSMMPEVCERRRKEKGGKRKKDEREG
jgi:hypothetical protein